MWGDLQNNINNVGFFKGILNSLSFWLISILFVGTRQFLLSPEKKDLKVLIGTVILGVPLASFIGNSVFEYTGLLQFSFLITAISALMSEAIIAYFIQNDDALVSRFVKKLLKDDDSNKKDKKDD